MENKLADVNDIDAQGATALHYATLANNDVCVKFLIDKGAIVDAPAGDLKATPLHWASRLVLFILMLKHASNEFAIDKVDYQLYIV